MMAPMRIITVDELGRLFASLPGKPRVVVSGNVAVPWPAVRALDENKDTYTIHALNAPPGIPDREGVTAETCFVGAGMRRHPDLSLRAEPAVAGAGAAAAAHPAGRRHRALRAAARRPAQPGHRGQRAARRRSRDAGSAPVASWPSSTTRCRTPSATRRSRSRRSTSRSRSPSRCPRTTRWRRTPTAPAIGERVASRVSDGATLQMGIGGVPDATLNALTGRRGLRVWTEMFSDGVLELDRVGALDPHHPLTASFLFGSRELYDWLDGNHRVRMMRTEHTNDPGLIAQQRMMTSVNTALEVDLFGQANASRINARIYSGFGGQTDFIVGALHSAGWPVVHRAALVAPQGRRVDRRAAARRAGDQLPAERDRHRARHRRAVGLRPAGPVPAHHPRRGPPAGARRAVGGSRRTSASPEPLVPRGLDFALLTELSAEMAAMTTTSAPDSALVVAVRAALAGAGDPERAAGQQALHEVRRCRTAGSPRPSCGPCCGRCWPTRRWPRRRGRRGRPTCARSGTARPTGRSATPRSP